MNLDGHAVISTILPPHVAAAEAFGDCLEEALSVDEAAFVSGAVEKRRREFAAGRSLARHALAQLHHAPLSILVGPHRQPAWPAGIVGSITHCPGYCAAVVARADTVISIGIDAEVNASLPEGVLSRIAREEERAGIDDQVDSTICWDRLLFSAKESVFKAWFPLTHRWLGFEEVHVAFEPDRGTFRATLIGDETTVRLNGQRLFEGRFMIHGGHQITAVSVPPLR